LDFKVDIIFETDGDKNVAKMIIDCDPESTIQVLPEFNPSEVTDVTVNNAGETDLEMLIRFLKPLTNLESLKLNNTKFLPDYKFKERLTLPNLRQFVFDQYCEETMKDYFKCLMAIDKSILKSRLFFDKGSEWDFDTLIGLNVDIKYTNGTSASIPFELNHERKELYSKFVFLNADILSNIPKDFELKMLTLNRPSSTLGIPMIVNVDWIPSSLTKLSLSGVNLEGGDLSDILKKCRNLVYIRFHINNYTKPIELNEFPLTLKDLYLHFHTLKYSSGTKLNLNTLDLNFCKLVPEDILVDNFEQIFSVRDILIYFKREEASITYTILAKALKSDVTKMIVVRQIDRQNTSAKSYNEVETILENSGVNKNKRRFVLVWNGGVWTEIFVRSKRVGM